MKSFYCASYEIPADWRKCLDALDDKLSVNEKYIIEDLDFTDLKNNSLSKEVIRQIYFNWMDWANNSVNTFFHSKGLYDPQIIANLIFIMYWSSLGEHRYFSSPEAELLNRIQFVLRYKTDGLTDK